MSLKKPPLIAHVIYHLDVGGLENGLINLINHIPPNRYRHAIICQKGYTDFRQRITRNDVEIIALNKQEGIDFKLYLNLFKALRQLNPDIVHTRNLGTMEAQLFAVAARVKARVHGEHGRDIFDLNGQNRKYNLLRKFISPFINHFITVSKDLETWLIQTIGVPPNKITQIYNGVDNNRFHTSLNKHIKLSPLGFFDENTFVIGSVGRMAAVKDYPTLVHAFIHALKSEPSARKDLRLLIVGDGISRNECIEIARKANIESLVWFPGERTDIPALMQSMNLFVLPSLGEGISNTILEAMSCGLPVVATHVGGNIELVKEGVTGKLIEPGNQNEMAEAILTYYTNTQLVKDHGNAARQQIEQNFSMDAMVNAYLSVYDKVLQ